MITIVFTYPSGDVVEFTEETFLLWRADAAARGLPLEQYLAAQLPADQAAAFARIADAIAAHRGVDNSDEEERR